MYWQTSRFTIDLNLPRVMGIVNVTPDSFSEAGEHGSLQAALARCDQLVKDGADILDVGGESTRPGALPVSQDEELSRVLPILRYAVTLGLPVSVDTYKPAVMQAALDLGADIINDVWALHWPASADLRTGLNVVREHPNCGVCLMHMHRNPRTMQASPMAGDAVPQVLAFFEHLVPAVLRLGVDKRRICIDPGIGFGKTVEQNFALLARQRELTALGYPLLTGWSRKSSLVAVTQQPLAAAASRDMRDCLVPSVAAALLAVQNGAHVVRVHDVKETVQALKVWAAMQQQKVSE